MKIFVINVGDVPYAKFSLPLIKKLCDYNSIELIVLKQDIQENIYKLHPSWLKLFCHKIVNDDFILCWDLDLVPTELYDIKPMLDLKNLNMCYDRIYMEQGFAFNSKFKFNCGLIGIPKSYQRVMETVYSLNAPTAHYPSYEQYYVNDFIHDNNINVNLLDSKLNKMFNGNENFSLDCYNAHYTGPIGSLSQKCSLVENHYNKYKENFAI
jgi:hypothetical protein